MGRHLARPRRCTGPTHRNPSVAERTPFALPTRLGLSRDHTPKFAKRYAELGDAVVAATRRYVEEVRAGAFPAAEQSYKPNKPEESGPRVTEQGRVVNLR